MVNVKEFAFSIKATWLRRLIIKRKWGETILSELNTTVKEFANFGISKDFNEKDAKQVLD